MNKKIIIALTFLAQTSIAGYYNTTVINEDVKQQAANDMNNKIFDCIASQKSNCIIKMQNADLATAALDSISLKSELDYKYSKGEAKINLTKEVKCFNEIKSTADLTDSEQIKKYGVSDFRISQICRGYTFTRTRMEYDYFHDKAYSENAFLSLVSVKAQLETLKAKGYKVKYTLSDKSDMIITKDKCSFFKDDCTKNESNLLQNYSISPK